MKKDAWKPYVFWIGLAEAVGAFAGWLTRAGVEAYRQGLVKPPLSPPGAVFPVVWIALYALMGLGAARIYLAPASAGRSRALGWFLAQLGANFVWPLLFFDLQQFGLAFFWLVGLWALILGMIVAFWRVDRPAAWLQIPYLLWVTFAAYLNLGVWILN